MKKPLHQYQGFSLLEVMVSMMLSLLLLTGLISLYENTQKTYLLTQALAHMQEDGRIAMQIFAHDLRMVGYVGCGRLAEINLHAENFNVKNTLVGWHNGHSSATMLLPVLAKPIKPQTDILLLQKADDYTVAVKSTTNTAIHFAEKPRFADDDLLLISDCQKADIVRLNNPHFAVPYQALAQANHWQKIIYYAAATQSHPKQENQEYTLYRRDLNASPYLQNALLDGVEDLQIAYGEISVDGKSIQYVNAAQVKDWQKVRSVQINLLLISKTAVLDAPQSYIFQNKLIHATDRKLHRTFQMVVALRQRLT